MTPIVTIQRRLMQLGRIRLGDKTDKGAPQKLGCFRLTSASRALLEAAATEYGGSVAEWSAAPDEGMYELYTTADALDIILPPVFSDADGAPTVPVSQYYELWSGGGCQRRCDGVTEILTGQPCLCNPDSRECKITTRINVMLPRVPGLGVWRMDTHGYNAAAELPATLDLLMVAASQHQFVPAVLRLEQRSRKIPGEGTKRFVVPVIDLPGVRVQEMLAQHPNVAPVALNPPRGPVRVRPELPTVDAPTATPFDHDPTPDFGEPPPLPTAESVPLFQGSAFQPPPGATALLPDMVALTAELQSVADQVGAGTATAGAIIRHRAKHDDAEHAAWLARQLVTAQKRLEQVTSGMAG